jgi:UDP-N-acetylmuramyl pentapeptide phosphotransferase/UDP-N-acetylglucosamine-1-phosphate transferase
VSRPVDFPIAFVLGGVLSGAAASRLQHRRRPAVTNYRGRRIPAVLGIAIVWSVGVTVVAAMLRAVAFGPGAGPWGRTAGVLVGMFLVFLGGRFDDRRPRRTRGLIAQLRPLARGTLTPGAVKLVAAVAGAAFAVLSIEGWTLRALVAIPAVAGAANLWNLLDVRPGRSLKFLFVALGPLALASYRQVFDRADHAILLAALGAAVGVLWFDLSERAVLGDAGANVLGFFVGVGLEAVLSTFWLAVALAVIVVLHALSETITLSAIIRSTPPLRWFDDLGTAFGAKSSTDPAPSASMKSRSE